VEEIKIILENKRKNALEVLDAWEADLIKNDKINKDIIEPKIESLKRIKQSEPFL